MIMFVPPSSDRRARTYIWTARICSLVSAAAFVVAIDRIAS